MIRATLGEAIPLQVQVGDGRTNLYPRAKLYDSSGSLLNTLSLTHVDNGLYSILHTINSEGFFTVAYELFEDAGFMTPSADYDIESELIEANSDKTNILKIIGLTYDNSVLDGHFYDEEGFLLSVRVRNYDSKANAILAGATGLVNTWNIAATYSSGRLNTYKVLRE
jgi:hypothetical protein